MDKYEWDVIEARRKDGLILTTLWKAENDKPIDIHWNKDEVEGTCYPEYIPSGKSWRTHEIDSRPVPHFTTDRNACALVLDKIEKMGDDRIFRFLDEFRKWCDITVAGDDLRQAAWFGMRALPNLICYAAVKAVEEVP